MTALVASTKLLYIELGYTGMGDRLRVRHVTISYVHMRLKLTEASFINRMEWKMKPAKIRRN